MKLWRWILAAALAVTWDSRGLAAGDESCTAESLLGFKDATNSPVAVRLALKSSSLAEGIALRVEIENQGAEPYSLHVCPTMKLCCVSGLHPMLSYGDTGMGLCDVCASAKPAKNEVFLPSGATFAFNMRLPPERLPAEAAKAGKAINVFLCYELGEQRLVHSNVVKAELR